MAGSELNTFVKGMIKDIDPHYQDKTTYRDATNARILSHRGKTFTIENIQGNSITTEPVPNVSSVLEIKFDDDMFAVGDLFYFDGLDIEFRVNGGSYANSGIQSLRFNANFATAGNNSVAEADKYAFSTLEQFHKDVAIWIRGNYTAGTVPIKAASDGSSLIVWYPHSTPDVYELRWNNSTSDPIAFTSDLSGGTDVSVHSKISASTLVSSSGGINSDLFINSYYEFTDFLIVLTQHDAGGDQPGQIWKLEFNDDGNTSQWTMLYNRNLNFNKERKLIVEGIQESDCIEKIYFTDFSEDLRSANILDDDLMGVSPELMSVFPHIKLSKPILQKIEESGQLLAGVYQYAYRLITDDGGISPISHFSQLVPITDSSENAATDKSSLYEGSSAGTLCGKGIRMKITGIDTRYNKIQIIAIRHEVESLGTATGVDIIEEDHIVDDVFEFVHTDYNRSETFTFDELLQNKNSWSICKDIAVKDNRLFAGNLKNTRLSLDFDEKAKSYDTVGTTYNTVVNSDHTKYRYLDSDAFAQDPGTDGTGADGVDADAAKLVFGGQSDGWLDSTKGGIRFTFHVEPYSIDKKKYDNTQIVSGTYPPTRVYNTWTGGNLYNPYEHLDTQNYDHPQNGFFRGPTSPYWNDVYRGYQRGEIYRFGIVFYDKRGNPDFARWVADVKIPDHHEAHITNYAGHYINNYGYSSTQKKVISTTIVNDTAGHRYYEYDGSGDKNLIANYTGGITTASTSHVMISVGSHSGLPDTGFVKINDVEIVYYVAKVSNSNGKYLIVDNDLNKGRARYGTTATNHADSDLSIVQYLAYDDVTAEKWTLANTGGAGSGGTDGFSLSFSDNTLGNGETGNTEVWGQAIFPKFEVRLTEADRKKISGYSIVRVERQASDKTIVAQGLLSQVFRYARTDDADKDNLVNMELDDGMGMHPFPCWNKIELGSKTHNYDEGGKATEDTVIPGTYMFDCPDHHFNHTDLNLNDTLNIDVKANLSPRLDVGSKVSVLYPEFNNADSQFSAYTSGDFHHGALTLQQAKEQEMANNRGSFAMVRNCSDVHEQAHDKWIKYYTNREVSNASHIRDANGEAVNDGTPTGNGNLEAVAKTSSNYAANFSDTHRQAITEIVSVGPGETVQKNANFAHKFYNSVGGGRNTIAPAYSVGTPELNNGNDFISDGFYFKIGNPNSANFLNDVGNGFIFGKDGNFGVSFGCPTLLLKVANRIFYSYDIDGNDPRKPGDFSNLSPDNNGQYYYSASSNGENTNHNYKFDDTPDRLWQLDKKLVNLKRNVNTTASVAQPKGQLINQYGGTSESDRANNRYISTTHFQPVFENEELYRSIAGGGDVFVDMYMFAKHTQDPTDWELGADSYSDCGGPNYQMSTKENMYTCGIGFPVETSVNLHLREGNYLDGEGYVRGSGGEDFIYNSVYSQQNNLKGFTVKPVDFCESTEHFPSTVAYSDVKLMGDTTEDAWMRWDFDGFHDLDQKYGDLSNLFIVRNDIYAIQETAVSRLAVNPRAILPSGDGVSVNVTSSGANVIERHDYFSEIYGSQHQHSLVIGENAAYWFDVLKRKIVKLGWTEEGAFGINKLSDKAGLRNYLRDLFEGQKIEDMPLLARGIHGIYDKSTDDVIFTINNSNYRPAQTTTDSSKEIRTGNRIKKTLVYNEGINAFTSFYTFYPRNYLRYGNYFYSVANYGNDSFNEYLYKHNDPNVTGPYFYGNHNEFSFEIVLNDSPLDVKTFDTVILVAETEDDTLFDTAVFSSDTQSAQTISSADGHYRVREGRHIIPVRALTATTRIRDTYMHAKFSHTGTLTSGSKKFNIFAVQSKFRKSYR